MVIFGALSAAAGEAKSEQKPAKRLSVSVEKCFMCGRNVRGEPYLDPCADGSAEGFSGER